GRLFETWGPPDKQQMHEMGTVTVWDPPARLVFTWRGVNFRPDELTEVEVLFEPGNEGTRVKLTHRGWASLPTDHPVRHGTTGTEFARMIGLWWGDLMTSYREHF